MNLFVSWVTANHMYFKISRGKLIHLETKNEGCTYRMWDICVTESLKQLMIMVDRFWSQTNAIFGDKKRQTKKKIKKDR